MNIHLLIFFFFKLQLEQSKNEIVLEQILAGTPMPPKHKKYRDLNERIKNVAEKYSIMEITDYLTAIAYNTKVTKKKIKYLIKNLKKQLQITFY